MKYFIQRQKYSAFLWTLNENIPMEDFFLKIWMNQNKQKYQIHGGCWSIFYFLRQSKKMKWAFLEAVDQSLSLSLESLRPYLCSFFKLIWWGEEGQDTTFLVHPWDKILRNNLWPNSLKRTISLDFLYFTSRRLWSRWRGKIWRE